MMALSMKPSSAVWSVCLIVGVVVSPDVGNLLHAQRPALQPGTAQTSRPKDRIVFELKHAQALDARDTISRIFDSRVVKSVAIPRLNSLIVTASREELEEVQRMIEVLDREPPVVAKRVKIFRLSNIEPDNSLAEALSLIDDDASLSIDPRRGTVIAAGSESTLIAIGALLTQLDRQPDHRTGASQGIVNEHQVRLVWLVAGFEGDGAQAVPADLENVTRELAKIGITDLKMAAQLMINTLVGHDFTTTGTAQLVEPCIFELSGSIEFRQAPPASAGTSNQRTGTASPTSRHLQLQLDLLATKQNAKTVLCQLKTTIKAPIGQSVVLGVTPLDSMTSVFVVQVRPKSARSNN